MLIIYLNLILIGGSLLLWSVGCLGLEPRLAILQVNQARRWGLRSRGWRGVRAVPRLCIKLGPGICLTAEENHGKTSVRAHVTGLVWSTAIYTELFMLQSHVMYTFSNFPLVNLWMLYQCTVIVWLAGLALYQYAVCTSSSFRTGLQWNIFTYFACF